MLKTHVLASSAEGRPIQIVELVNEPPTILIVGGVHGDEPQGAFVGNCLVELLQTRIGEMMDEHLIIVPRLNPDGLERGSRKNSQGVDINRNFPTANWQKIAPENANYGGPRASSEIETQLVLDLIRKYHFCRILTLHCIDSDRQCVNYDGPAQPLAELMARENGYPVKPDIGYATPGSLGTWTGYERQIPTITLELPAHQDQEQCWRENRDAIMNFIQADIE